MKSIGSGIKSLLGKESQKNMGKVYRNLTSSIRMLPSFIIVGAQKAGTTSLYSYLKLHPQIYPGVKKEIQFFSINYSKGVAWYRSHFPLITKAKKGLITGEATPYYLYHPHAAKRIAETLPNVKLIILLRDPVERAISAYWFSMSLGNENLSIHEAFKREKDLLAGEKEKMISNEHYYSVNHRSYSFLDRSKYVEQLKNYFQYFERDKIMIIKSEDFFDNPDETYKKVLSFLDLSSHSLPKYKPQNTNTVKKRVDSDIKKDLRSYFQSYNEELYELLDRDFKW